MSNNLIYSTKSNDYNSQAMNIAILSRNPALYSTQSLVRAARKKFHFVRVINYAHCDLLIESGKLVIKYHGEDVSNFDAVIPRIGSSLTQYGSAVIKQYESLGVFSTIPSQGLLEARNKLSCLQILASHGLGVPKSIVSNNHFLFGTLLNEFEDERVVVKLLNGTHGIGVLLADTHKQAEAIMEAFFKTKQKCMMQEFIEEANGADLRIFVVDGEIVGTMKRQAKEGEFRSNLHRGGSSEVVPITPEEADTAIKACDILNLKIAGVDMLRSKEGPLILEVNASPGLEGIETTTGVDISKKIIEFIERNVK